MFFVAECAYSSMGRNEFCSSSLEINMPYYFMWRAMTFLFVGIELAMPFYVKTSWDTLLESK